MIRRLLSGLAVMSALCSCVLAVCPGDGIKKYLRFCCCLCALSFIVSFLPLQTGIPDVMHEAPQVADLTADAMKLVKDETAARIRAAVAELAYERYGVAEDDIKVEIECEGDAEVRINAVRIELYGLKYAFVVTELKNRVAGLLGVGCEVEIIV